MSKLQSLVSDTWRGMIERRLWPVAVVLLAGLIAIPLLLTAEPQPAPAPPPGQAADEAAALAAQPLVAVASPSEREKVRRVLGARKNPFRPTAQPKREKRRDDTDAGGSASERAEEKAARPATTTSSAAQPPGYGGGSVAPAPLPPSSAPDVTEKEPAKPAGSLTVRWGFASDTKLEEFALERLDSLPDADDPLVVYMGLTKDRRSAIFMLDAGVAVDGDGTCRPDPAACESVELAIGETEFIEVANGDGETTRYQLDLVKIHGRTATATRTLRAKPAEVKATRRLLRSSGHSAPADRMDAPTGSLQPAAGD